jgi:pyruvate formate lyase activating enzyme
MKTAESPVFGCLEKPSLVDFPDRMALVLFVSGCNFRCGFCHNAALLAERRRGLAWTRLEEICRRFRENWVDAAVISGGEPTLTEELDDLIRFLHGHGFAVKLDTNGSKPERLLALLSELEYVAMDVKCSLPRYAELTGFEQPQLVADSIAVIRDQAADYEFRTTVIEGFHNNAEMRAIAALIRPAKRYVLQPFIPRPEVNDPELRQRPRTSSERLQEIRALLGDCAEQVLVRGA